MTQNMARAFQEMESLSIQATRVNNSRLHTRIQTPDAEVRGRSIANPSPIWSGREQAQGWSKTRKWLRQGSKILHFKMLGRG